jgi:hypothetical protein
MELQIVNIGRPQFNENDIEKQLFKIDFHPYQFRNGTSEEDGPPTAY